MGSSNSDGQVLAVLLGRAAFGSTHDKNFSRETHPTVSEVLTKSFERLTPYVCCLLL